MTAYIQFIDLCALPFCYRLQIANTFKGRTWSGTLPPAVSLPIANCKRHKRRNCQRRLAAR